MTSPLVPNPHFHPHDSAGLRAIPVLAKLSAFDPCRLAANCGVFTPQFRLEPATHGTVVPSPGARFDLIFRDGFRRRGPRLRGRARCLSVGGAQDEEKARRRCSSVMPGPGILESIAT